DPAGQADRWLVTSRINLQGGNYLLFDYASLTSMYPESMEIKLSTGGTEPADFTILLESVSQVPANGLDFKLINLGDYTGSVRIAFRLTSNDAYLGLLDNVRILGSALSINNVENNASFGVYPNPANDFVTISEANGAEVKVIDMLGRTLISKVVKSTNETISINDLQTGMYMIQIVKDGQTSSQKLIKR
ncbi:MAG: T9SS type A sorting domain-containing protein, partial [Bacteroidales bacterium]